MTARHSPLYTHYYGCSESEHDMAEFPVYSGYTKINQHLPVYLHVPATGSAFLRLISIMEEDKI